MRYRNHILEYLGKNRLMSLATSSGNKPWAATVFFAYDRSCNIFFYSRGDTRHAKHIARNPAVAITFNQYNGKPNSIKGLQITGRASKVPSRDLKRSYALYRKRFPWAEDFKSDHALYIIRPRTIDYIDQELFGHFYRVKTI